MSQAPLPGSTSTGLLHRALCQDNLAWNRISELYCPLVYHWSRTSGLPPEDALDLSQEVMLVVYRSLDRFQGPAFRGWLWGITRNHIASFFRRRQRKERATGGSSANERLQSWSLDPPAEPDDPELRNELLNRLLGIIRPDFTEETWSAFCMLAVEKRPVREIAEQLGLSEGAVKQAKYRVLKRLKEELPLL